MASPLSAGLVSVLVAAALLLTAIGCDLPARRARRRPGARVFRFPAAGRAGQRRAGAGSPTRAIALTLRRHAWRARSRRRIPGRPTTFVTDLVQARRSRRRAAGAPSPAPSAGGAIALGGRLPRAARLHGLPHHRRPDPVDVRPRHASPSAASNVITFQDVAGVDEAKDEVKEIVDFLREPERFSAIGGRIPKGVLLVGPPGTGKTLLARSIAGEAGVPFLFASGSDFVEMYAGVGAARVRRLFQDARRHTLVHHLHRRARRRRPQPRRQLAQPRGARADAQPAARRDGRLRSRTSGIVVIAATNRQDILDPALLRPGRFDRQVTVGNPDLKGREAILRVHARKVAIDRRRGPAIDRARHARVLGRRSRQPGQRGGAVRRPRRARAGHRPRHGAGARQGADGRRAPLGRAERARSRQLRVSRGRPRDRRGAAAAAPIRCTR